MLKHMSDAEYFAIDAVSNSALKAIQYKSPAYYMNQQTKERKETEDMTIGTALHMMLLQPTEVYMDTYLVIEPDLAKSYCKKAFDFASDQNKLPILQKNHNKAARMAKSVKSQGWYKKIFTGSEFEQVCLKEIMGVQGKSKMDIVNHESKFIADLKTCISIQSFERDFFKYPYCYHMQNSWYSKVMMENYDFIFIAVEKDGAHDCAIYMPEKEVTEYGLDMCATALDTYAECKKTGIWPGYHQKIRKIKLPGYLRKEMRG